MKKLLLIIGTALFVFGTIFYWYSQKSVCPCSGMANTNLVVGTNAQFAPYEFLENGEIVGFDIDLINEIARRMNKTVQLKDLDFDMLLLEAQVGNVQVVAAALTPTQERAEKVLFTQTYLGGDPLVIVTRASDPLLKDTVENLDDLKNKEVVVNEGFTSDKYVSSNPDIIVKRLATVSDAMLSLSLGRSYAFVTTKSAIQPFFAQYDKSLFVVTELPVVEGFAFAVSKKHASLLEPINKILEEIAQDGTLNKIKEKWHIAEK